MRSMRTIVVAGTIVLFLMAQGASELCMAADAGFSLRMASAPDTSGIEAGASAAADTLALVHLWKLHKGKPDKDIRRIEKLGSVPEREAAAATCLQERAHSKRSFRLVSGVTLLIGGAAIAVTPISDVEWQYRGTYMGSPVYIPTKVSKHPVGWVLLGVGCGFAGLATLIVETKHEKEYKAYKNEKELTPRGNPWVSIGPDPSCNLRVAISAVYSF
jgi:hypothetical protein